MTEFDKDAKRPEMYDDATLDRLIREMFREADLAQSAINPGIKSRLLAEYDALQRKRKNRLPLRSIAEALGIGFLARPAAAAGVFASISAIGFVAGAAVQPASDAQTFIELASALDQSYVVNEENGLWAEE